ncbi:MAG: methyltransferase domain-containing protein [Thermoanaerobaculia bacterium]|nr:methyltransferase domain-containing protein [Thermoanaerobaculia bacterium]
MLARIESLRRRKRQPEVMDQPGLDPELHRGALEDLARLHRMFDTAGRLFAPIRRLPRGEPPLSVLDLACGGGTVAVELAAAGRRNGVDLRVTGADISPLALEVARREARRVGVEVDFVELDVVGTDELPRHDVIVSSLFLHHLSREDVVELLARMAAAASRLVLADDLVRSLRGWLYTYTGCRLFFRSPVVRVDGPLSVEAAFTPVELAGLAQRAGLAGAEVKTSWPQRQLLIWKKL